MAKVKYLDLDGTEQPVTWAGHEFHPGKAVDVEDEGLLHTAMGNPHFEVTGYKPKEQHEVVGQIVTQPHVPAYGSRAAAISPDAVGPTSATVRSAAVEAANPAARPGDAKQAIRGTYGVDNPLESQKPGKPPTPSTSTRSK
jgi:hypothetical protein